MNTLDLDHDDLDAILFRFWIRAASEFPGDTMRAIFKATTPAEYRAALIDLAKAKRINLPERTTATALFTIQGEALSKVREALCEVVDGIPAHHLAEQHAPMTIERAREIRTLAGLDAKS